MNEIERGMDHVAGAGSADKAEGKTRELVGQGKELLGDALGNDRLRAEGAGDQVEGKVQQTGGMVQEKAQDVKETVTGEPESLVDRFKSNVKDIVENFQDGLHDTNNAKHPVVLDEQK